jgi:hypothetical protein
MIEAIDAMALCHHRLLQIQCQAAGQGRAVSEGLALQEVTIKEGQETGRKIRDGCPTAIAVIMSL